MAPSNHELENAVKEESEKFATCYSWIQEHMPPSFFREVDREGVLLISHALMAFSLQNYFSEVKRKDCAYVICLDSPDADLKILEHYRSFGIKNYRAFVSNAAPPFTDEVRNVRIATLFFTPYQEKGKVSLEEGAKKEILDLVRKRNPLVSEELFNELLSGMNQRFLLALPKERFAIAVDLYARSQGSDSCQMEMRRNENFREVKDLPSCQIVIAWKNVPKRDFLFRIAKTIHRHNLSLKKFNAAYITASNRCSTMVLSLGIDGMTGKAAWIDADLEELLQELSCLKYFEGREAIDTALVDAKLLSGTAGNVMKVLVYFIHQVLVHQDANLYSIANVEEGLIRHPELTALAYKAFEAKFHPQKRNLETYQVIRAQFLSHVEELDTGHVSSDMRRKNILLQAMNFIDFVLKCNVYCKSKTGFCFRLDPEFIDRVPYVRKEKFPELPFGIFFMKGMRYFGFHIRFKDLSRGGLRTVLTEHTEQMMQERNQLFFECYHLAYTQQKKNKDIPEGGAKGIIFLEPYERVRFEEEIYARELLEAGLPPKEQEESLQQFHEEHTLEYLYQAQRSYIEGLLTLVNCREDGTLQAADIVDDYRKPEYLYLGPDENMHNEMIEWIAEKSREVGYRPGISFISSKPRAGINHKEYGITSLGINVYVEELLKFLGIDPKRDSFKIKMTGGPDGDVAGNEILILKKLYPTTAKLIALTDISGTIFDSQGLDLSALHTLFRTTKPIAHYPPQLLSENGFLLDRKTQRESSPYTFQTLCLKKKNGKVIEEWLSGSEMNHLYRTNIHKTAADIFIPGGGRPKTLNESNFQEFLTSEGHPSAKAIVEGANLYLSPEARVELEKRGVYIIKDSSANKGGVICSSFEVLAGLILSEEEFLQHKPELMKEVLAIICKKAELEAKLLLRTHIETGAYLTDISEWISERINQFTYELLDYLTPIDLPTNESDPLIRCLLSYCPPLLQTQYKERILTRIPPLHQKAIISCAIASSLVYSRGLGWRPSIVEILPLLALDTEIAAK